MSADHPIGRLPVTVRPDTYELQMTIRPDEGRFSGRVRIAVRVLQPTKTIILHAQELEIVEARVESTGGVQRVAADTDAAATTVTMRVAEPLGVGPAVIDLAFSGGLNRQMKGLYEARATVDGAEERYAFTQFEPTDARRCFPCFDEPGFKAVFQVTVTAPAHLTVLSNMPAIGEDREGAMKTVRFAATPVMSTYLLALAAGRLVSRSRRIAGTEVAVWAMPRDLHLGEFALDVTAATLPLLNEYFALPYPYPKLDLVAVPDFAMGAMENWGAIFFRDSRLLVDPARASTATQRVVANVIVHELVHQWFGNLVTMAWWDDLWLNEAFATWLACKIVDRWRPEWRSRDEFQLEKQTPLAIDALESSRPIVADVVSSAEIESMFDPLTYEKGAAVLRMIEEFLGEGVFCDGIRAYMARHRFGNTVAADLWRELEAASGHPIGALAKDWLTQAGYPIVTARAVSGDRQTIELRQRKFSAHGASARSAATWSVPVALRYEDRGGVRTHRVLLSQATAMVTLPGSGPVQWVYPNGNEAGFYRVDVDPGSRDSLRAAAVSELEPAERLGLLNHLWALAQSGDRSLEVFLDTLAGLAGDDTRVVVEARSAYLDALSDHLVRDADRPRLARLAERLCRPLWERLGWEAARGEDDERRLARAATLWSLGSIANAPVILDSLSSQLDAYWRNPSAVDPTLVAPLLRLGARVGDEKRFLEYHNRFRRAATPEERDRYLSALAEFPQPDVIRRVTAMTLTDEVRGQDAWKPFRVLLARPVAQSEAWSFLTTHWPALRAKTGSVGATRLIQSTRALLREEWHTEVRSFFTHPANRVESAARALDQTLEFLRLGLKFKAEQQEALSRWLGSRVTQGTKWV